MKVIDKSCIMIINKVMKLNNLIFDKAGVSMCPVGELMRLFL